MRNIRLPKKILVISSWAPPMRGASPLFFERLFANFDPSSYAIFTTDKAAGSSLSGARLPGRYFYFNRTRTFIGSLFDTVRYGRQIIYREDIEVLIGLSDKGHALVLTWILSKITGKPYALYLFDPYKGNRFGFPLDQLAFCFEPMLLRKAAFLIVPNEAHAQMYRERYGKQLHCIVITNTLLPHAVAQSERSSHPKSYEILYTGNIYWAQERSVLNVIRAIRNMTDIEVRITLYTTRHITQLEKKFADEPRVRFASASPSEMSAIQSSTDILLLPLSWHTNAPDVINTATPGKTSEYLISGRPILVHAPAESFLAGYARKNGFAEVVDTENQSALQSAIRKLLMDKHHAAKLIENARATFVRDFDLSKNARAFSQALQAFGDPTHALPQ